MFAAQDNFDLRVVPKFTYVTFENGAKANAMQFLVIPIPLSSEPSEGSTEQMA